ncbi:hypothetical protein ETD83_08680 [Actinomadura soli]|uniref:Mutator family transposase n=1 Tax=Actinomadura soli TaxID=2508997 RepID=A0A5C4JG93_9ACTN|nr:hypothetical protein ETD83_08680 [Actinomadura soli]
MAEVYGAQVSKQTISTITDKVIEGMSEWQNRPLDPGQSLANVANPDQGRSRPLRVEIRDNSSDPAQAPAAGWRPTRGSGARTAC